ncbi:MAG: Hsp20/alpha crystallin family protein [Gammaproteobacteria bacterium]|nr:Hsp20/alpha crystallin family protein [Gammaproteobacteria bacterium]
MGELTRESQPKWGIFSDDFDNLFEGFFRPMRRTAEESGGGFTPAADIVEKESEYIVKVDLPGVRKEDVEVSINNGVLTISGETKYEKEEKDKEARVIRSERHLGRYVRSMQLGNAVDESKVQARYEDGVLEVVLPKTQKVKPKKVAVDIK